MSTTSVLLDTHALLWWLADAPRMSRTARECIASTPDVFVSAVSAWEIATKQRLGELSDVAVVVERFGELAVAEGFQHLSVSYSHGLRAGSYTTEHRDPFDRMIAAQAELEDLLVVTCDPAFAQFPVQSVW